MSRNSKRIWPYSSSMSSNVIDLGVNGKPICDFLLVINCKFSCYLLPFSRYSGLKIENCWFYPPLPCLMPPLWRNPLEFLDDTYPAKTNSYSYTEPVLLWTTAIGIHFCAWVHFDCKWPVIVCLQAWSTVTLQMLHPLPQTYRTQTLPSG